MKVKGSSRKPVSALQEIEPGALSRKELIKDRVKEQWDQAKEKLEEFGNEVKEKASEAAEAVLGMASKAENALEEVATESVKRKFTGLFFN